MRKTKVFLATCLLFLSSSGFSYSANKVWFEFQPDGSYKVIVNYTVPELKEFRESYVIFYNKKSAETFYWALVRGADFYPAEPYKIEFKNQRLKPEPW